MERGGPLRMEGVELHPAWRGGKLGARLVSQGSACRRATSRAKRCRSRRAGGARGAAARQRPPYARAAPPARASVRVISREPLQRANRLTHPAAPGAARASKRRRRRRPAVRVKAPASLGAATHASVCAAAPSAPLAPAPFAASRPQPRLTSHAPAPSAPTSVPPPHHHLLPHATPHLATHRK